MAEATYEIEGFTILDVHVEPKDIRAEGVPEYPRLIVPAKFTIRKIEQSQDSPYYRESPNFVILSFQAQLFIVSHPHKIADSIVIFDSLGFDNSREVYTNIRIEFPLDHQRIKFLEEKRQGDMTIGLEFRFLIASFEKFSFQVKDKLALKSIPMSFSEVVPHSKMQFDIPQSIWIRNVLPSLGVGEFFIIEMPKGNKTIKEAWTYLEKAEIAFSNWHSKEVFANCRETGTLLDTNVRAKFGEKTFSYEERWKRTYERFNKWASLDLHLEDLKRKVAYPSDSVITNKADAEHLIIMTKALIKFAEQLLREK